MPNRAVAIEAIKVLIQASHELLELVDNQDDPSAGDVQKIAIALSTTLAPIFSKLSIG